MWEQKYGDPIYTKTFPRAQFRLYSDNPNKIGYAWWMMTITKIPNSCTQYMYIQKYTQCLLYIHFAMYICYLHICVCDTQRLMDFSPTPPPQKKQAFVHWVASRPRRHDVGNERHVNQEQLGYQTAETSLNCWCQVMFAEMMQKNSHFITPLELIRSCTSYCCYNGVTSRAPWDSTSGGTAETNSMIDSKWRHEVAWYIFQMYPMSNNNYMYTYITIFHIKLVNLLHSQVANIICIWYVYMYIFNIYIYICSYLAEWFTCIAIWPTFDSPKQRRTSCAGPEYVRSSRQNIQHWKEGFHFGGSVFIKVGDFLIKCIYFIMLMEEILYHLACIKHCT